LDPFSQEQVEAVGPRRATATHWGFPHFWHCWGGYFHVFPNVWYNKNVMNVSEKQQRQAS